MSANIQQKIKPIGELYGGLFIDDYQYNSYDYEPPEIAILLGLRRYIPTNGYIDIEYARSNDWVYNQPHFWNKYIYYNQMIGDQNGPDFDMFSIKYSKLIRTGHINIEIFNRRKGDNSPLFKYPAGPEKITDYFLTGIVEKRTGGNISLHIRNKNFFANARISLFYTNNFNNTNGFNRLKGEYLLNIGFNT